ncbi:winged helix-turn-helix transcriptional regulator [Leucobacter chromiireducens]|uniref:Transcriptional regulator n=1 Tax=Leucobacter chromiireducens subsp. solipictus TaxID=398235 RepID=A0ABS1SDY2_9MICO|nr:helix-turn-helix domain-containing protein [Leucobacter chromiireducens]MBL3678136.1 transcriptional regulator [Leucobacter chromiireducens subsp. solipictus]
MSTATTAPPHPTPDPALPHAINEAECRLFREAAELAGRKWTAAVLLALARGAQRFSELASGIDGISDRLLAARLRELEAQGLVTRTVIPSTPVQIRYGLTSSGAELIRILHPLVQWARRSGAAVPSETPSPAG